MRFLSGHESPVSALAHSHSARLLATGDDAGLVQIWDLVRGERIATKHFTRPVNALALLDDPLLVCSLAEGTIVIWEIGRPELRGEWRLWRVSRVRHMLFTRDGKRLFIAGDDGGAASLHLWWLGGQNLPRRGGYGLVLSGDGGNVATSSESGSIYVWHSPLPLDLPRADFRHKQRLTGHYRAVASVLAFSPDGGSLYSAITGEVVRWDLQTGMVMRTLPAPPAEQTPLSFSPGGRLLLASDDEGILFLRETASGRMLDALDWGLGPIRSAMFSPDGMTAVATGADGRVVVWDVEE